MSFKDEIFLSQAKTESEGLMHEGESILEDAEGNQYRLLEDRTLKLIRPARPAKVIPERPQEVKIEQQTEPARDKIVIEETIETRKQIQRLADSFAMILDRSNWGLGSDTLAGNVSTIHTPGKIKNETEQSYLITGDPSNFLKKQSRSRNLAERQASASAERVAAQQEAQLRRSNLIKKNDSEREHTKIKKGKQPEIPYDWKRVTSEAGPSNLADIPETENEIIPREITYRRKFNKRTPPIEDSDDSTNNENNSKKCFGANRKTPESTESSEDEDPTIQLKINQTWRRSPRSPNPPRRGTTLEDDSEMGNSRRIRTPKPKEVREWNGDGRRLNKFIRDLILYFAAYEEHYNMDRKKILTALNFMGGRAENWVTQRVLKNIKQGSGPYPERL